jgi:hypothetical protein
MHKVDMISRSNKAGDKARHGVNAIENGKKVKTTISSRESPPPNGSISNSEKKGSRKPTCNKVINGLYFGFEASS